VSSTPSKFAIVFLHSSINCGDSFASNLYSPNCSMDRKESCRGSLFPPSILNSTRVEPKKRPMPKPASSAKICFDILTTLITSVVAASVKCRSRPTTDLCCKYRGPIPATESSPAAPGRKSSVLIDPVI